MGKTFLSGVKTAAKWGAAIVGAAAAAGTAAVGLSKKFLDTAESTREFRTSMAKLETSFTTAGLSAKDASKTYAELYSILGDDGQATEAAAHLAQLTNNEKDLQKWTNICTGVYATFGDSLPIEGLTEAANETAKTGQITGSLADALNWVGVKEDDFQAKLSKCTTEQQRQALITDTLNGLYSEQSEKYKELNKDVISANEAQAKMNQSMAQIGAVAEPINAAITSMAAVLLETLVPVVERFGAYLTDKLPAVSSLFQQFIPIVTSFLEGLLPPLLDLAEQILPPIMELLSSIIPVISDIAQAIMPVIIELLNMLLPPLVQIVQMLLPLLVSLIEPLLPLLQPIIQLLQPLIDLLMEIISPCVELINAVLPPLISLLSNIINFVLPILQTVLTVVASTLSGTFNGALKSVIGIAKNLMGVFTGIIDFVKNVFTGNWRGAWNSVIKIFSNIWGGLKNVVKTPINAVIGIINGFIRGLNKLKIPSWVPGVGGKGINISTIPLLAEGGNIVKAGRVIVGEAGAELIDLPTGAKVTPLTDGKGNLLASDEVVRILTLILAELKALGSSLYDTIVEALVNGTKIDWNDRELARLVKKYA